MCPYTLDHNKMLASTMQHSTHNHTPNPTPTTTPDTSNALGRPGREWPPRKPRLTAGVSSGPNSVPSPPPPHGKKLSEPAAICVPPSRTHAGPRTREPTLDQMRNSERRPQ